MERMFLNMLILALRKSTLNFFIGPCPSLSFKFFSYTKMFAIFLNKSILGTLNQTIFSMFRIAKNYFRTRSQSAME